MGTIQNIPKHIDLRRRLDGYPCQHAAVVDIPDQIARVRLEGRRLGGALGSCGCGGFVVEAVEVAACCFEFFDPFLGLGERFVLLVFWSFWGRRGEGERETHLGNHHVAVKRPLGKLSLWSGDVFPDHGDDGGSECYVGDKVAVPFFNVSYHYQHLNRDRMRQLEGEENRTRREGRKNIHNVNVQPIRALLNGPRALLSQLGEIRRENRRCDDCWRCHFTSCSSFCLIWSIEHGSLSSGAPKVVGKKRKPVEWDLNLKIALPS